MATETELPQAILRGLLRQFPTELHDALDFQFFNLPARYFRSLDMRAIQTDLRLVSKIALEHVIVAVSEHHEELTIQVIVEKDEPRIFLRVVAILASHGINILKASIYTGKKDSVVIDHFMVSKRTDRVALDRACAEIKEALISGQSHEPKLPVPDNAGLLVMCSQYGSDHTTVTVAARDQIGFLYRVARVFADLDLRLNYADIKTPDDHIVDTFYVVTSNGAKLTADMIAKLRNAIYMAFSQ